MRIARIVAVVFLLLLPVAGATGLGDVSRQVGGHDFSRAESRALEARALAAEGSPRSEAEVEAAVRAQPDDWALHVELIEASAAANRLPERARWYQSWLAEDGDDAPANPKRQALLHAALGTVHWRGGDLRNARVEYRQAVRLDSGNPAYTEALETLDAQLGWKPRDTLLFLLFFLIIVAYVALRRRRWAKALRG